MLSDLLKVKASVINDCQKIIREQVYNSSAYDGVEKRNKNDEKGFIIQPLIQID